MRERERDRQRGNVRGRGEREKERERSCCFCFERHMVLQLPGLVHPAALHLHEGITMKEPADNEALTSKELVNKGQPHLQSSSLIINYK